MCIRDSVRPAHAAAAAAAPTGLPSRPAGGGGAAGPDPEMIRLQILADPRGRAEVRAQNPDLVDAAEDPDRFRRVFLDLQRQQADADRARQREMAMLNDDYLNPEAQAKIEEVIRQKAVMENLQNALEYNPEAFGKVHMLYVDVEVNNHKVKAFVDSGAQATIMSPSCAEACGIMRLVDRRFAGIARGVGTAKIIGRVHWAQIKIGNIFLACSFTVMEGKDVELLLGLDMLKRHQARIDLGADRLAIQGENVPFLGEADIPKTDAADALNEPSVEGPGGTRVGARSGAVVQTPAGPSGPQGPGGAPTSFAGQGLTLGGRAPAPPPQAQPPVQQQPQPQHQAQAATYPAETIAQLQQLGFSRAEAIAALDATGGNVDYAAGLLFQER
ncbi:MAG: DNA damage-inducible protein 1 [Thelocarpon impressellum]|nr:MAG: DNA damage-inducible protein 1 [Thelocarpon impressellum]